MTQQVDTVVGSESDTSAAGLLLLPTGRVIPVAGPCPIGLLPGGERSIWPEIPEGSDVLNVGFAPGQDEVAGNRPFIGASGVLLRTWLRGAGLLGRSAFTNVELHRTRDLKCRYCGIDYWLWEGKWTAAYDRLVASEHGEGKPPTKTQQKLLDKWEASLNCDHRWREWHANREPRDPKTGECCGLPILLRLLRDPRWKIVLCWGAVPARELGGYKGAVGHMVGRFRTLSTGQTATVLYHPAYALRQRGSAAFATTEGLIREVLRQVNDRLEHPQDTGGYPFVEIAPAPRVMIDPRSVIDIETTTAGPKPDPRVDTPKTLCVGWEMSDRVELHDLQHAPAVEVPAGATHIMHNAQYDLPLLMRMSGEMNQTADDTMVMAYLCGEPNLGLKILGRRVLGRHAREYLETDGNDPEYAAQDPHLTRDLYDYYRPRIDSKGLSFLYDQVKTPLQRIMARHVVQGLPLNHERVQALHSKMTQRSEYLAGLLRTISGHADLNPASIPQVEQVIFDELGLPPAIERRQPKRTTGEPHIGQFRSVPFVSTLLSWRRAVGFTKVTQKLLPLERISGLYDLTGTGTDRVSQHDRNCMNFNALVKACIEAEPGGYFVYGDYSQIELRYAAYFSHDEYLLGVLREGRNMHEELCIAVYGVRTPETYTQAKSSNFAKLFGAGVKKRAQTLKMPIGVVQRNEIPWPDWDAWVARRRYEPARTYWGYERNISDHLESADEGLQEKAYRETINSIIQGSAGETTQYAQVLADAALARNWGGYVIHQEHDSVLGWVPGSTPVEEAKACLKEAMERAVPDEIKAVIACPVKVIAGRFWG